LDGAKALIYFATDRREPIYTERRLDNQVSRWHEQIGDPTIADGILDRLVHNAHRIEMRGGRIHAKKAQPTTGRE